MYCLTLSNNYPQSTPKFLCPNSAIKPMKQVGTHVGRNKFQCEVLVVNPVRRTMGTTTLSLAGSSGDDTLVEQPSHRLQMYQSST